MRKLMWFRNEISKSKEDWKIPGSKRYLYKKDLDWYKGPLKTQTSKTINEKYLQKEIENLKMQSGKYC